MRSGRPPGPGRRNAPVRRATGTGGGPRYRVRVGGRGGGRGERQASGGGEPGAERPDEDAEERPGRATGPAAAAPAGDAGGRAEAEPAGEPRTAEEGAEPPGAEKGRGLPTNFFVMGFTGALGVLTAWMLVEALVEVRGVFINILVA